MHCRYSFVPWLYSEESVRVSGSLSGDLQVLLRCSKAVTFVEFCMGVERERERERERFVCLIKFKYFYYRISSANVFRYYMAGQVFDASLLPMCFETASFFGLNSSPICN